MEQRDLARLLACARIGLGAFAALMPSTLVRLWVGPDRASFPTKMLVKGLGVRDLVIGVGILATLDDADRAGTWLLAGAAADAGDALGTLGSWSELGSLRALGLLTVEVGAAALGASLAESLD